MSDPRAGADGDRRAGWTAPALPWDAAHTLRTQCFINQRAHYMLAEREEKRRRALGIPATALAAFVAGFTFSEPKGAAIYIIGGCATLTAVLIAIQTFLNPAEAARQYHAAGIEFGGLKRRFDLLLLRGDGPNVLTGLEKLYPELDRLAKTSPIIPDDMYEKARAEVESSPLGDIEPSLRPPPASPPAAGPNPT
jgi:hypothetical protein